ncbi:ribonuclease domain-containing protein [uncultured Arsenicicoccus sp.]|uniref:ribonuclease domain-containing protein n=1 Tax=uncultured Arsenicicoccus sp. TaxID=491339 RepID=UPI00259A8ACF|nr:ribonuclease domain-containing protein [uncultured Arsenicicoccus sp.]
MPPARRLAALLLGGGVLVGGGGLAGCTTPATQGDDGGRATTGATGIRSASPATSAPGSATRRSTPPRSTAPRSTAPRPSAPRSTGRAIPPCSPQELPAEVPPVIAAIRAGGPFRHPRNDGVTSGNRERLLPQEARGYYREYTVDTPGASTRGTRRIITGGGSARSPLHWYYTADHYESFCEIGDA